jgi:putative DNA primase/helicase
MWISFGGAGHLHKEVFGAHEKLVVASTRPTPTLELPDFALIGMAKLARNGDKSARLWGGDTTGYNTPSEATAVLLCLLAYYTNKNHWRMDRLFRQSGLMRNKWDRKQSGSTWGALEIGKAGGMLVPYMITISTICFHQLSCG